MEFGYSSLATVHQHISALKKKGLLVHEKNSARSMALPPSKREIVDIPIVGQFASSHPLEFFPSIDKSHPFAKEDVPEPEKSYFLRVRGHGLQDEQIEDQDLLLIEATTTLNPKEIGLFTIPGGYTLLKRYAPEREFIRLEPISITSAMNPEIFRPHELKIQGKLLSLIRSFTSHPNQKTFNQGD